MEHSYAIEGMHCASCTAKVAAALEHVPGVARASVSLAPPVARIEMHEHVQTAKLKDAVAAAGPYRLFESHSEPEHSNRPGAAQSTETESLYPLILIVGYLAGATLVIEGLTGEFSLHRLMQHFMAGFFLVFSFFKFLDLRGFSDAYRSYDVVAKNVPAWGMIYPFVELALGVAYLWGFSLIATNVVTLLVMLAGSVGVLRAVRQKQAIRCACLGTVLNLPMTKITLVEDLGMAAMAAVMLVL